jgi:AcrR family transcriptional regulator
MAEKSRSPSRAPRADAQRNRDAILAAARATFERDGVLASLDGIAADAGVGNATLYRNFPTRDDLLAEVMAGSIADATAKSAELSSQLPPGAALAEWVVWLTWQLRIWHDLPYCIATARSNKLSPMNSACNPLLIETEVLLARARSAGAVTDTVTAEEIYELITTLSWGVDRFADTEAQARRRVALGSAGIFA